jgi:hypothetical protein
MDDPRLIVQVPQGSAVERRLVAQPPAAIVTSGGVVVEVAPADADGVLEPPPAGEIVMSLPSPEALRRDADEVRRVTEHAGRGIEPLVIVIEAADELRDEELTAVLDAAGRTSRAVILRVVRDG